MNEEAPFLLSFGEALKAARKRKRLTQKQLAHLIGVHYNTISAWELGSYLPETRGLVLELARHLALDSQETRQLLEASLTALVPHWSVPWLRNPFFTGRQELLETLKMLLGGPASNGLGRVYALQGMGGVGKTQVALEYAYRHALDYSALFWVNAESNEHLTASFLRIAEVLRLAEREEAEQPRVVAVVRGWLDSHDDWLLIWDNLEDLDLLAHWLPATRRGTVLLTTRLQALGTLAQGIEVVPMEQEEGVELLIRRAKVLGRLVSGSLAGQLVVQQPEEYKAAVELTRALGGLPLALDQAGAYIEETGCQLRDYLERYRQQGIRLLGRRGISGSSHPQSVAATLLLTYERARLQQPVIVDLLRICAFLAAEAIPEEFFRAGAAHLGQAIQALLEETGRLDEVFGVLRSFSLVQRQPQERTISLHQLVQEIVRAEMEESERTFWQRQIVKALNAAFPQVSYVVVSHVEVWAQCERLLPHVLVSLNALPEKGVEPAAIELTQKVADYFRERGQYEQAAFRYDQALSLGERILGNNHPALIPILSGLGRLAAIQGKFEEAESLLQRALNSEKQLSGAERNVLALPLSGLAAIYTAQGKYEQAIDLYQQALSAMERMLGARHPEIATVLSNMSYALLGQGKDKEAEPLLLRALHMLEHALGPENPEVGFPLSNLGNLYTRMGKYEQAEGMLVRALHVREQALGSQHVLVAATKNDLADIYKHQGKYEQAEVLLQEALPIMGQALGTEHPAVAQAIHTLGDLYAAQERYEQAEPLLKSAIQHLQQTLGDGHELVAASLNALATIYRKQEKYAEAEQLYREALSIREQRFGKQHPETACTLYGLALLKQSQGEVTQAYTLAKRVRAIRLLALGEANPLTCEACALYEQLEQTGGFPGISGSREPPGAVSL